MILYFLSRVFPAKESRNSEGIMLYIIVNKTTETDNNSLDGANAPCHGFMCSVQRTYNKMTLPHFCDDPIK
jgi:hypothetical protein